jgi:lysophospholipase L1-like esterase
LAEKKRIMCYADSLTWGWVPVENAVPTHRYPYEQRWTGVMAAELGDGYEIVEEALSGRTTAVDDPTDPRLNGASYLPSALASHLPLDLVIFLLGSNDTKVYFHRSPFEIAAGMAILIDQVAKSAGGVGTAYPAPQVLLVAPPPLARMQHTWFAELFKGGLEKSAELAHHYEALATFLGIPFLNAGEVISTGGVDGIHLTAENNEALGKAIARKVEEIDLGGAPPAGAPTAP